MSEELKNCPFCGEQCAYFEMNQGFKWGAVVPGCLEVRTDYDESDNAPWRKEAAELWNTRFNDKSNEITDKYGYGTDL